MIKTIIFDFGGVLVRTGDPAGRREWEQRLNLAAGELERVVHGSELWANAQRGLVSVDGYWQGVADYLGLSARDIPALRNDYFRDDFLDRDLMALIASLRAQGYKVGLLSNDAATLEAKLRDALAIYDQFDAVIISATIGVMKPEAGAYEAIVRALNVTPDECIFIDDNLTNIAGAQRFGMQTIHYISGMDVRITLAPFLKGD